MSTDFQISIREWAAGRFHAEKLQRAARAFGRRMRRLRETANLTPTELADAMNMHLVDGGAIIDAEMGVALYSLEMAKRALQVMRDRK